mmetsp:Transcript_11369/g.33479  ORF Transcript_11369/g.33479 Transcript_11369/m.33479 type:complete len:220 (-) Transcript_11369:339-998(-)
MPPIIRRGIHLLPRVKRSQRRGWGPMYPTSPKELPAKRPRPRGTGLLPSDPSSRRPTKIRAADAARWRRWTRWCAVPAAAVPDSSPPRVTPTCAPCPIPTLPPTPLPPPPRPIATSEGDGSAPTNRNNRSRSPPKKRTKRGKTPASCPSVPVSSGSSSSHSPFPACPTFWSKRSTDSRTGTAFPKYSPRSSLYRSSVISPNRYRRYCSRTGTRWICASA